MLSLSLKIRHILSSPKKIDNLIYKVLYTPTPTHPHTHTHTPFWVLLCLGGYICETRGPVLAVYGQANCLREHLIRGLVSQTLCWNHRLHLSFMLTSRCLFIHYKASAGEDPMDVDNVRSKTPYLRRK